MKVTSLRINIINTTKLLSVDLESKIGNLSVNISGVLEKRERYRVTAGRGNLLAVARAGPEQNPFGI